MDDGLQLTADIFRPIGPGPYPVLLSHRPYAKGAGFQTGPPELALEPLNCRVLCRYHNALRQNRCTDAERHAVHAAIAARGTRRFR